MKAILFDTGYEHPIVVDTDGSLDDLQQHVGGFIEHIALGNGAHLWCNELGKLEGLPVNRYATAFAYVFGGLHYDVVVGKCIVLGLDDNGDSADVPAWCLSHLALDIAGGEVA